ncbi:MAG: cytidine deaminase [Elusimicrobia bacterium]|nr:cytidine deaminase [Elusimicrobiota bacterium]
MGILAHDVVLSSLERQLLRRATECRKKAYCPYSRYPVGAAVLASSGRIYEGCNVENVSFGLTCCAERVAIFNALSCGERRIKKIAIVGREVESCGACRQVLQEFGPRAELLLLSVRSNGRKAFSRKTVPEILPFPFKRFRPER